MAQFTGFAVFENIDYPFCADISKYEKEIKIGQGTYGWVQNIKISFLKFNLNLNLIFKEKYGKEMSKGPTK